MLSMALNAHNHFRFRSGKISFEMLLYPVHILAVLCLMGAGIVAGGKNSFCGKPSNRIGRIVGGRRATNGEFPFMVSLRGPEEPGAAQVLHKCGAVLLDRRWILTAAHCVFEYRRKKYLRRLKVRLGGHDTSTSSGKGEQEIGVETLWTHPKYQDPYRQSNDIALLRLQRDANLETRVFPACLPDPGLRLEGMNATVAGWGRMSISADGSGDMAKILQKVDVPILSNKVCKNMYKEAGESYPLEENQMCAGYREGGKDSCKGDSGGPLFVEQNGKFTVIGLVSTGIKCGSPLLPGIYTRVISHLRWIAEKMAD